MPASKTHRSLSLIIIIAAIFTAIAVCVLVGIPTRKTELIKRTDIDPIKRRFPKVSGIQRVIWIADAFGSKTFGKNEYWLKGYIFLSDDGNNELSKIKTWELVEDWNPDFLPDEVNVTETKWYHSEEFDNQYKGEIIFIANFHYSSDENMLYFYAETN
jgi:hypothetical protein